MSKHFAFDNSLASIEECLEALEHRDRHKSEDFIGFSTQGLYSSKHSQNTTATEKFFRCKHEREISNIKQEIDGLRTVFIEKTEHTLHLEALFHRALNQIAVEMEGIDEKRKKINLIEAKVLKKLHPEHGSINPAAVIPPYKNLPRSPGEFSFSNNEGDETSNFSFGQTDENIEVHLPREKDCKDFEEFLKKQQSSSFASEKHEESHIPYIFDSSLLHSHLVPGEFLSEKYRIEQVVNTHHFSSFVQCFDVFLRKKVGIKVIHSQKEGFEQGLDEIKIMNLLQKSFKHPGQRFLVRLIEFFYFNDHLHIVFELLGDSLFALNSNSEFRSSLRNTHLAKIANQVLTSLAFIHSQEIVHSNINLKTILLASNNQRKNQLKEVEIKITGFGNSFNLKTQNISTQSQVSTAPEVMNQGLYTKKMDIWDLGCMLIELITGSNIFEGINSKETLKKVRNIQIKMCLGDLPEEEGELVGGFFLDNLGSVERIEDIAKGDKVLEEFLKMVLTIDHNKRPSAEEALNHPFVNFLSM